MTRRTTLPDGDSRHGTVNGYVNHMCRCAPCTTANTDASYDRRQDRYRQPVPPGVEHGPSCYRNWGCRCEVCSSGNAELARYYRARRRARQAAL